MMRRAVFDRDGVLIRHGFTDFGATGELREGDTQVVVPNDFDREPGRWQTLDGGLTWQPYSPPPLPDWQQFERDMMGTIGDPLTIAALLDQHPAFLVLLRDQNTPFAAAYVQAKLGAGAISQTLYDAIKAAAIANRIPDLQDLPPAEAVKSVL